MAIDSAQRRQNALLEEMLIPDDAPFTIEDRYQLLGQFYPIPPTGEITWGGMEAPLPKSGSVLPAPFPKSGGR